MSVGTKIPDDMCVFSIFEPVSSYLAVKDVQQRILARPLVELQFPFLNVARPFGFPFLDDVNSSS